MVKRWYKIKKQMIQKKVQKGSIEDIGINISTDDFIFIEKFMKSHKIRIGEGYVFLFADFITEYAFWKKNGRYERLYRCTMMSDK